MTSAERDRRIKELKTLLQKSEEFIRNGDREWVQDLEECKQDYDEAVKDLEEAQADYQKDLDRAVAEQYSEAQIAALERLSAERIDACQKHKEQMEEFLKKAQESLDQYPELLRQAKADRDRFEVQLAALEPQTNSPLKWVVNIGFWVIVIAVVLKACS